MDEYARTFRSGALGTTVITVAWTWVVIEILLTWAALDGRWWFLTYDSLAILAACAMVAAYVFTGIWLWRVRYNADLLAPDRQRRTKVWIWLSWIVPIVNLWFPKQVIDDAWRATIDEKPETVPWWPAWLCVVIVGWLGSNVFFAVASLKPQNDPASATGIIASISHGIFALSLWIAAGFWSKVVRTVSDAQNTLVLSQWRQT